MAQLNHTIIWSSDPAASARFLTGLLGLSSPSRFGRFHVVELANGVSLDFATSDGPIQSQHYAFLIEEAGFDALLAGIAALSLDHWADPMRTRPASINHDDGGRGVYFHDPDGHLLEVITRPYGSSGASGDGTTGHRPQLDHAERQEDLHHAGGAGRPL